MRLSVGRAGLDKDRITGSTQKLSRRAKEAIICGGGSGSVGTAGLASGDQKRGNPPTSAGPAAPLAGSTQQRQVHGEVSTATLRRNVGSSRGGSKRLHQLREPS